VKDERIIDIEGDPDSPISGVCLCPKGAGTFQLVTGAHRTRQVLHCPPGGTEWETLPLDPAMVPGLVTSFGRGGATTFQQDLQNSDCIVIQGSNMAECHPVGFCWVMEAKRRGATIIHVDPRFTRTSAVADVHVPIRAGSDIAFLGGIINYILSHERYFKDYVVHYTNAATIIDSGYKDTEELDGLFSGWNPEEKRYETKAVGPRSTRDLRPAAQRYLTADATRTRSMPSAIRSRRSCAAPRLPAGAAESASATT